MTSGYCTSSGPTWTGVLTAKDPAGRFVYASPGDTVLIQGPTYAQFDEVRLKRDNLEAKVKHLQALLDAQGKRNKYLLKSAVASTPDPFGYAEGYVPPTEVYEINPAGELVLFSTVPSRAAALKLVETLNS